MYFLNIFKLLLRVALRVAIGVLCICIINGILAVNGYSVSLGINIYTLGLLAIVGIPSLILCYGLIGM